MKKKYKYNLLASVFVIAAISILSISTTQSQTKTESQDATFYLNYGKSLIEADKLDSAEKILKIANSMDESSPEIVFMLGLTYFKKGKYALIPFEKLLELLKVDNYSTAIKHFKKALKLKPDYWEARYYMGRTYLLQNTAKSLVQAEKEFLVILEFDKNYRDTAYQLANVYQNQNEYDKAIFLFQQIIADNSKDGKAFLKLAEIYFIKQMNRQACYFYTLAMDNLDDPELLESLYDELFLLMTDDEKKEYENAAFEKKGFIVKKFWKIRDPSPGDVENERLSEHYRRIRFAREHFHITVPPYYDDRGRIFIKFGDPDARFVAPVSEMAFRGNESWSYENIHKGLVFDFVEDGGIFHLVQDLREAAGPGEGATNRYYVASVLYEQRSHISNTYARLGSNLTTAMYGHSGDMHRYESMLNEYIVHRNEAISLTPPEVYRVSEEQKQLPLVYRMAQFRGDYDKTQLEIYFSVLGNSLPFEKGEKNNYYTHVDYLFVAIDSTFEEVVNKKDKALLEMKNYPDKQSRNFLFRQAAGLHPGNYWINLVVQDEPSNMRTLIKLNKDIRDFSTPNLSVSDIQLSFNIQPVAEAESPKYIKQNLNVVPYPFNSVYKKDPIFIYYEIYNLKYNENGKVNYTIEYKLETLNPKENFWSKVSTIWGGSKHPVVSLFEDRKGDSATQIEYIAFDLDKLMYGLNRLTVTVKDKFSEEIASSSVEFNLIK